MTAGQFGALVGCFLAAAGVGYIFLGILWTLRVYRRAPRSSTWSAIAFTALIGINTAISANELILYGLSTALACGFMIVRARRILFPKARQGGMPAESPSADAAS